MKSRDSERFFDKAVSWFKRQEQAMGNLVSKGWEWFKYTSLGYKAVEKAKRAFVDTVDTSTFNTEAYRAYSDNLYAYGMFQELRDRWHERRVSETTQHFLLGGLIDSPQRMGGILVARAGTSPDDPMLGKEYLLWLAVA